MTGAAIMDEDEALRATLAGLREEHRALDARILAAEAQAHQDMLAIRRLKKEKLVLKDRIRLIEDRLLPDIIA